MSEHATLQEWSEAVLNDDEFKWSWSYHCDNCHEVYARSEHHGIEDCIRHLRDLLEAR